MYSSKLFGSVLLSLFLGTSAFGDSHSTTYSPSPKAGGSVIALQDSFHDATGNPNHTIESLTASIEGDYLFLNCRGILKQVATLRYLLIQTVPRPRDIAEDQLRVQSTW